MLYFFCLKTASPGFEKTVPKWPGNGERKRKTDRRAIWHIYRQHFFLPLPSPLCQPLLPSASPTRAHPRGTNLSTSTGILNASLIGRFLPLPDPQDEAPFSDPESSLFDYQHMDEPGYSSVDFDKIRKRRSMSDRKREGTPPLQEQAEGLLPGQIVNSVMTSRPGDNKFKFVYFKGRGRRNSQEPSGSRVEDSPPTYTQTEREIRDAMRAVHDLSSEEEAVEEMVTEVRIEPRQTTSLPPSRTTPRDVQPDTDAHSSHDVTVRSTRSNQQIHHSTEVEESRALNSSRTSSQHQRELEERCRSLAVENEERGTEVQQLRRENKSLRKVARAVQQGETESAALLLMKKQIGEMKDENEVLQSSVHRLNVELGHYQAKYKTIPPDSHGPQLSGLPSKGPIPSWLINTRYLSPLLLAYDKRIEEKNEVISKCQRDLASVKGIIQDVVKENEALQKSYSQGPVDIMEWEQLKENARLILEENQNLLEQVRVKDNKAHDMHQAHISEVSKLTKQLVVIRSEKSDVEQQFTDYKQKFAELRRRHDDHVLETKDTITVQQYIDSIAELKKQLIDEENNSKNEVKTLALKLHALQIEHKSITSQYVDAVAENRRLHAEIHAMHKSVRKAQNRMILLQKAIEQSETKELSVQDRLAAVIKMVCGKVAMERDTYAKVAKDCEHETKKTVNKLIQKHTTVGKMEEKLKLYKMRAMARLSTAADRLKDQDEVFNSQKQEYEREIKFLRLLVHDKEKHLHDVESEKRTVEEDMEAVWQSATSENERMRESLRKSIRKLYKHTALQETLDNERKELVLVSSDEEVE
ncbi:hypothetical protein ScPMuIL_000110 [Solemya velum]